MTEKTICASVALASYDLSIARTYKLSVEYFKSKSDAAIQIAELKKSQKKWLSKRDACGSDTVCLEKAMGDRITDLDYELAQYGYNHRFDN